MRNYRLRASSSERMSVAEEKKATKTKREEREEEKIKEDGRREEDRSSRRAGRINKRGAPPSHLRHLYFAAPHGRKSSSVSERRDTMWRSEVCEQKGRQGVPVPRVQDHGHLPRVRAQHSSLTLPRGHIRI